MAVAKLDLRDIDFDLNGHLNAGGKVHTYAAGGTTPLATFTDVTGGVSNANPIVLDSSGQAHIWLTVATAYKFVFADANDVTLYTENGIAVADPNASLAGSQYADIDFFYASGPPAANELIYLVSLDRAVSWAANFVGSYGKTITNPTASFVVSVRKNATAYNAGTQIGTITVATNGAYSFATTSGATQSGAIGDTVSFWAPSVADTTMANFSATLAGALA